MVSLTQFLTRSARINNAGIATIFGDRKRTWGEIFKRVKCAAGMLKSLGVAQGDRVAVLAANGDTYLEYFFSVNWVGAVIVPINTRLAPAEVEYWLNDSGASVLVVGAPFVDLVAGLQEQFPDLTLIYMDEGQAPEGYTSHEEAILTSPAIERAECGDDDLAGLFYTGGTTGRSKGVMITHRGLFTNVFQWATAVQATPDDKFLLIPPMFHAAGGANTLAVAALSATGVILPQFDVPTLLATVERERVTNIPLVATMVDMIVKHPQVNDYDLSSVTRVTYGASPIPVTTLERALEVFPNAEFFQVYGQTEGGPTVSVLRPKYHVSSGPLAGKLTSTGVSVMGTDICIMDENGQTLGANQVGEVCVDGPGVSPGYWNLPDVTAESRYGQWLRTGDAGYIDTDGFLFISDRIKDMIISGGENVYPAEVENVLSRHPAIEECAVIGIPSEKWGEQVHAIVRLKPDQSADEQALISFCKEHIAGFKCIRGVTFRTEPFPITAANKVLKRELRKPFWAGKDRSIV